MFYLHGSRWRNLQIKTMSRHVITMGICAVFSLITVIAKGQTSQGKTLFLTHCTKCHGEDGTRGRWGAKNLQTTKLADAALQIVISNGRGIMPRWSKKLDAGQIAQLVTYIRTLKTQ